MPNKYRISSDELKRIARKALEDYNRIRAPEAIARLIDIKDNLLYIEFSGSYCETCGLYDWIEDFKYVLEDLGVKAEIVDVIEPEDPRDDRRIGIFRVDNIGMFLKKIQNNLNLAEEST